MKCQVRIFHTVGSSNLDKVISAKLIKGQKLVKAELRFLCTALHNEIYLPTDFLVDTDRHMDGQMDKAATICSPFGKHKKH